MTHRVYLRWPGQEVTQKTTTESRTVAEFAFLQLCEQPAAILIEAVGISWTENGRHVDYVEMTPEGKTFIDGSDGRSASSGSAFGSVDCGCQDVT